MAEYIERQVALDALGVTKNATKYGGDHSGYDTRMLYEIHDALTGIPAADVAPVVHGKWINEYWHSETVRRCSVCKITQTVNVYEGKVKFNYCPYCGAKMDGKREE